MFFQTKISLATYLLLIRSHKINQIYEHPSYHMPLRGEIPLEPLKKAVFSILFWENENDASPDFLHTLEGII